MVLLFSSWGGVEGDLLCMCLGFILAISNKVILYVLQTCTCCVLISVCVSFGVAEIKDDLPLKLIV